MPEHHHIIIIGAGLSGLYTAWKLQQQNLDAIVLDARPRAGGRILSYTHNENRFDMGPAWVWPQLQPRLQQLLTELDLPVFNQFTHGDMLYEKSATDIERYAGQSSHQQSLRITNGGQSLIEALQSKIQVDSMHLNTLVKSLVKPIDKQSLQMSTQRNGKDYSYSADKIILALPPRLVVQNIAFNPAFNNNIINSWNSVPTWMAGHCKIIFIYEQAFWRTQGLSGEVFSHHGPLSEIYDGSALDANDENHNDNKYGNNYFALTAFVSLNSQQRKQLSTEDLTAASLAQLQRLFGEQSLNTIDIQIKDWSQDKLTASEQDLITPMQHPQYASDMPRNFWDNTLILAGTEVAREHAGYLEGALESADEAIDLIKY